MNRIESYPHFRSTGATCLKIQQSPAQWAPLAINPGDYMNMTTQCQLVLKNPKAYVDLSATPDSLCRNLKCKFPDATNSAGISTILMNNMPADDSYCGEGGVIQFPIYVTLGQLDIKC